MKTIYLLISAGILCLFSSATLHREKPADPKISTQLIGTWIPLDSAMEDDGTVTYSKTKAFSKDKPGISFKAHEKLTKRQNVHWCGTPPVSYDNFKGKWKQTSDSTITIFYKYWNGEASQDWLIVHLDAQQLIIRQLTYHQKEKFVGDFFGPEKRMKSNR